MKKLDQKLIIDEMLAGWHPLLPAATEVKIRETTVSEKKCQKCSKILFKIKTVNEEIRKDTGVKQSIPKLTSRSKADLKSLKN